MSEQQLNYISSYRLAGEPLQKHLQTLFPGETISITTGGGGQWAVYLPRKLEQSELDTIYNTLRQRRARS